MCWRNYWEFTIDYWWGTRPFPRSPLLWVFSIFSTKAHGTRRTVFALITISASATTGLRPSTVTCITNFVNLTHLNAHIATWAAVSRIAEAEQRKRSGTALTASEKVEKILLLFCFSSFNQKKLYYFLEEVLEDDSAWNLFGRQNGFKKMDEDELGRLTSRWLFFASGWAEWTVDPIEKFETVNTTDFQLIF